MLVKLQNTDPDMTVSIIASLGYHSALPNLIKVHTILGSGKEFNLGVTNNEEHAL